MEVHNIPIDIHANRLVEWLISRHHCTKEWPEKIATVRQKINAAMQDMPEHATIAKILRDASRKKSQYIKDNMFLCSISEFPYLYYFDVY